MDELAMLIAPRRRARNCTGCYRGSIIEFEPTQVIEKQSGDYEPQPDSYTWTTPSLNPSQTYKCIAFGRRILTLMPVSCTKIYSSGDHDLDDIAPLPVSFQHLPDPPAPSATPTPFLQRNVSCVRYSEPHIGRSQPKAALITTSGPSHSDMFEHVDHRTKQITTYTAQVDVYR